MCKELFNITLEMKGGGDTYQASIENFERERECDIDIEREGGRRQ